ncbi:cytochrome P450 [Cercophora newfieldiana]|uniref:Cytochrome P450 monooxygenase ABA1 n=1 Tax=Cercophora newfieldiana TaxID=92897 RepID=A0AA40CSH8_9PEZI|nr:cytochrome P450 [Cercophora newfieldiana]
MGASEYTVDLPGKGVLIAGALIAVFLVHTLSVWYRLSHIPGPPWAALSKYWMVKEALKGQQPVAFQQATNQYGTLVRVGPNELITDDPELMRKMMAVRSPYTRGPWYTAMRFDPARDNLFSMRDEDEHTKLRLKMAFGYSGKENLSMEATIENNIAKLINLIETKYLSTERQYRPMDFALKTQFFTLDVISDLAFGKPFGYIDQDSDVFDYIKITSSLIPALTVLSNIPSLAKVLHSRLFRSSLPKATDKLGFGALIGVTKSVVASRYHPSASAESDMLGSFIRHGLTEEEAAGEALLQVIAGSDTSATTIRTVMLSLQSNPIAYRKLQSEIDDAIASGKVSSPIKDSEARQLPYLQAVIKEGLRVLPPASGPFFKTVPEGGDVINGLFVPAGTQIGSSPLAIHHSKKIFGDDAETFRPERWLEADEERLAVMTSTLDLVFHYGKYMCLGKPVAMMEFNKIFVELLRRFDFSIVNPQKPAKFFNAGIWIMEDFWVRVTKR